MLGDDHYNLRSLSTSHHSNSDTFLMSYDSLGTYWGMPSFTPTRSTVTLIVPTNLTEEILRSRRKYGRNKVKAESMGDFFGFDISYVLGVIASIMF